MALQRFNARAIPNAFLNGTIGAGCVAFATKGRLTTYPVPTSHGFHGLVRSTQALALSPRPQSPGSPSPRLSILGDSTVAWVWLKCGSCRPGKERMNQTVLRAGR